MTDSHTLEIRLLGDPRLLRGGRVQTLPASRKTRALLGYLVVTGTSHLRERLCDLLWDGPDDPRAALRWSLTKLRPLLNDATTTRLIADRDRVGFAARAVEVDVLRVRDLLGPGASRGVDAVSTETLKSVAQQFRGELLDGLELPACYRFHEWCMGQREALSALRLEALGELVRRLDAAPDEALGYARAMVAADPLSESAHAAVVRLLGQLGRTREALDRYEYGRRLLEVELVAPLSGELDDAQAALRRWEPARRPARASVRPVSSGPEDERGARPRVAQEHPVPLVGRRAERDQIERLVRSVARTRAQQAVLITGAPGIGKSRLLADLRDRVIGVGGRVLAARSFEAELTRPYGAWIDALHDVDVDDVPEECRDDLALLLPSLGASPATDGTRHRLFDAVGALLRHLARDRLLAVVLDDIHWLDESSSVLLHFIARALPAQSGLLLACATRSGELDDNAVVARAARSLVAERRLTEIPLRPLDAESTAELVRATDPALDPAAVFAESEGNPLFILELTRAADTVAARRTLDELIVGRLARLDARTRDVLAWAVGLGRRFALDMLVGVSELGATELLAALGELERREILRPVGTAEYDFAHDLIRQTAYRTLSQPRRRLIHRQIARAIAALMEADGSLAGDLARHADLAGDHHLAARACVDAGRRSLRLFANAEAAALAEQGLGHLGALPPSTDRLRLQIGLLEVKILAAADPGLRRLPRVADELTRAVDQAEAAGLYAEAATGLYLLSVVHQEAGDHASAGASTLRAAAAVRAADRATRARQLANTARCLVELGRDVGRARALVREAETLIESPGLEIAELSWGLGLLRRWDGELDLAAELVERALELTRQAEDRWREYKCLSWLSMIDLERKQLGRAQARSQELRQVAARMGSHDLPFVEAVVALSRLPDGGRAAAKRLDRALAMLRETDDKSHLAYVLNVAAGAYLEAGRVQAARAYALEALTAAQAVRRRGELAIAESTLARISAALGDRDESAAAIARLVSEAADRDTLDARARAAVALAAQAFGLRPPTIAPTVSDENGRMVKRGAS